MKFGNKNIPAFNKRLVFGYISQTFKDQIMSNLPQLILHICLNYFNPCKDEWDIVHWDLIVKGTKISRKTSFGYKSAFLKNVVSSGIHIWNFKLIQPGYRDLIGIEPVKLKMETRYDLSVWKERRKTYFRGFSSSVNNSGDCLCIQSRKFPCCYVKCNDVIKMKLNFDTLTLLFFKNDVFVDQQKVHAANYKAGVSLSDKNVRIELIHYQHVYTKT